MNRTAKTTGNPSTTFGMTHPKKNIGHACGKMILSGEYAVVFGYPGIAVPIPFETHVTYHENIHIEENDYVQKIKRACEEYTKPLSGSFSIQSTIPIGRGLGSSTALVVAIARCLDLTHEQSLAIENTVNPGHSGIDFEVIWNEQSILFQKDKSPYSITYNLHNALLIDTGVPNETTAELVAWISERKDEPVIADALHTIGTCTKRLEYGEDLATIIRDHHRAQVALGIVPKEAQEIITQIEEVGGAAKVLGAGARTGGSGMIFALSLQEKSLHLPEEYPIMKL